MRASGARPDPHGAAGGGTVDGTQLQVGLVVVDPGGTRYGGADPHAPRPYRVVIDGLSPGDPLQLICAAPGGVIGVWWQSHTIDVATGDAVASALVCLPVVAGDDPAHPSQLPEPPEPPTIAAVWSAVDLPAPTLGMSPLGEGVTGLATYVWASSPTSVTIDVALDGYRVTGVARRHDFALDPGTTAGPIEHRADGGSAEAPAWTVTYEQRGDVGLSVTTTWDATVVMTGPGLPARPTPIGSALLSAARTYHVVEVRARLTG